MSYISASDTETALNGFGCGSGCNCGPCSSGAAMGEWYEKAPVERVQPSPPPAAAGPVGEPDLAFYGDGGYGEARTCDDRRIPERTQKRKPTIGKFACGGQTNARFKIVEKAINRALEMLDNTIGELVEARVAVCSGAAPAPPHVRLITLQWLNRLGVCVNDIRVWVSGTFVNRSVAEVIRRLVRARNLIASNSLRYICGGPFCDYDWWAYTAPRDTEGKCLPGTPPLRVHLCKLFWEPWKDPETNKPITKEVHDELRAQTIIHEASHLTHCTVDDVGYTIGVAECVALLVAATNGSPLNAVLLEHCSTSSCAPVSTGVSGFGAVVPKSKRVARTIFPGGKFVFPDGGVRR